MTRPLRLHLVLAGFGNVGRRFAALLEERRARIIREEGVAFRIVGIATRRHGSLANVHGLAARRLAEEVAAGARLDALGLPDPPGWCQPATTADFIAQVVRALHEHDPGAHVAVVETTALDIGAGEPAIAHVRSAFAAGAHAVTANKGPVAFAYRELALAAAGRGVSFLFEGAVMDGIPVFNLARETLPAVTVAGFRGVVNSTTNHILSAMEAGREFGEALAEMQDAGITEADPALDVDGWDAAAKAAALANVLMDARITPHDVDRRGIGGLSGAAVRDAVGRGCRLKLVASAERTGSGVRAAVAPVELPADDLLARLDGPQNAVILSTDLLGEFAIVQLDSGLTHTAYALLADLVTLGRRLRGLVGGTAIPPAPIRGS